jgi:FdhD protein
MAVLHYEAQKYQAGIASAVDDVLTAEAALRISINGAVFTITMRTPGNEAALVRGLLYAEDMYRDLEEHPVITVEERNQYGYITAVAVQVDPEKMGSRDLNSRKLLSVSSCGICGNTELVDLNPGQSLADKPGTLSSSTVLHMFQQMRAGQDTFQLSGGSHASAAFARDGRLLTLQEDIGRHNAVDKVIGQLILDGQLGEAFSIIVSGRISYEIVSKAFVAGIPVLAAVSAPSSLAVDYARELGLTLLAFCREEKFTVYAGAIGD